MNCIRCLMSEPVVTLDEEYICNQCRKYEELSIRNNAFYMEWMAERIRKKGYDREFDCIVGISGGFDSTLALIAATSYDLRSLAVTVQNGWETKIAVSNIKKVTDRLRVPLETVVLEWEEFREIQKAFLYASVTDAEAPTDAAIKKVLYEKAVEYGIKYIITGGNWITEGWIPKDYTYYDGLYIKDVCEKYGAKIETFPNITFFDYFRYLFVHRIETVNILNYDSPTQEDSLLLEKYYKWEPYGTKHGENLYTKFVSNYYLPVKFGIDKRVVELSAKIRSGWMTRKEAAEELKTASPFSLEELDYVVKKLELTHEEFDEIMGAEHRSFRDFKNYWKYLRHGKGLVRWLSAKTNRL